MPLRIPRRVYADLYGPTVGDRVRLADTDLIIEVEKDLTLYGDEAKFGGGKTLRDGMGQDPVTTREGGALDLVITNALIIDHWGIVKADVGVRDGKLLHQSRQSWHHGLRGRKPDRRHIHRGDRWRG